MLKTTYDALAVEGLKQPLEEISTACKALEINFFIVGAVARNIWLTTNDESPSGTKDVDFGVFVPDVSTYNKLKKSLVEGYDYTQSRENGFCLFTPEGIQVDLLPFGEIEEDKEVVIEGVGLTSIQLDGFKEVFEKGTVEVAIGEEIYKSCSIAGIVILKMIAYDDRPDRRLKDIEDIDSICHNYPTLEDDHIWLKHNDLYDSELEHFEIGMIVLGREMKMLMTDNEILRNRIIQIIDKAIELDSNVIKHMIKNPSEETIDMKRSVLEHIKRGLTD